MAEHRDETQPEADAATGGNVETSAAALALGMSRRRGKAAADPRMDAFLEKQTRLLDLQAEHLHEQRELQISRLRWGRFSDRMRAALQVMTAAFGLAIAIAVGVMAWSASRDHGLVIEAFSVPPDLAQRGLSGQVIASHVLDRLADMQVKTFSSRPAASYQNDWGQDIKVEIPETGVSAGELYRYLRLWLGHETHITGEVYRTADGIAVTARTGSLPGATAKGTEAELDALVQQAAEAVYGQTQPYRYAAYLASVGRAPEATAAFDSLARSGPAEERTWAYLALAGRAQSTEARVRDARMAIALNPRLEQGCSMLATSLQSFGGGLGHDEAAIQQWRKCADLARSGGAIDFPAHNAASAARLRFLQSGIDRSIGDYRAAIEEMEASGAGPGRIEGQGFFPTLPILVLTLAWDHDVSRSRRSMAEPSGPAPRAYSLSPAFGRASQAESVDDWATVVAELEAELSRQQALGAAATDQVVRMLQPFLAYAYARTGHQAQAEALVDSTPMDCDFCVVARGKVAAARQDWGAANRWFALVARRTPSLPFANTEWGKMLLAKGDSDGAIARLAEAHRQSSRYADPLELWGEALMRKGEFAGAVAKFAEADKHAPRWGRNHLEWGQALARLGRTDEAKDQWRVATGMDLSVPDRAKLAKMQASIPKRTS